MSDSETLMSRLKYARDQEASVTKSVERQGQANVINVGVQVDQEQ